jgi:hypothetical protein
LIHHQSYTTPSGGEKEKAASQRVNAFFQPSQQGKMAGNTAIQRSPAPSFFKPAAVVNRVQRKPPAPAKADEPELQRKEESPGTALPVASGKIADAGNTIIQRTPNRGANPADCLVPLCDTLEHQAIPTSNAAAERIARNWLTQAIACLNNGATASNASHATAIKDDAIAELTTAIDEIVANIIQGSHSRSRFRDFHDAMLSTCRNKQQEIRTEFFYNVLFESAGIGWGTDPSWQEINEALSALPEHAAWANPRLIHFRREECHPEEIDPATGRCGTGTSGSIGGLAEPASDRVTIFDAGTGSGVYGRAPALGIPNITQTFRHEVGHLVQEQLAAGVADNLFTNIMRWRKFSWSNITNTAVMDYMLRERQQLRDRTMHADDAALRTWLTALQPNVPVVIGTYTFVKRPVMRGSAVFWLHSWLTAQMPTGPEYEYARSDQHEYFAELYAYAISAPEFLSRTLPAQQQEWLRRSVFGVPANREELERQAAINLPGEAWAEFVTRGSRLFTQEQLNGLMNRLLHPDVV